MSQFDVAKRTLELADTMGEALQHIHRRVAEGYPLEDSMALFTDAVAGFSEIESVLSGSFVEAEKDEQLAKAAEALQDGFHRLTEAFEGVAAEGAVTILRVTLLPRYETWKQELRRLLSPHVVS